MALDEPQVDDEVVDHKGIKYLVNKGLLEQVKPINVDFVENERGSGFSISSNLAKEGGSSCGGSCSC
jgi:Fe-S cluster assembly iron-binding protein IscA